MSDFSLSNEGSIFILTPNSDEASSWCDEHLPEDVMTWGKGIVVEHRYIGDIVDGIALSGLSLE